MPDWFNCGLTNLNSPPTICSKRLCRSFASLIILLASTGHAAKLKPEAQKGWDRYVILTEARIDREQRDPSHFLWIDLMTEGQKQSAEARLSDGQVVIERLRSDDGGTPVKTPGALIHHHHWIGIAFIPGASVQQALALVSTQSADCDVNYPCADGAWSLTDTSDTVFRGNRDNKRNYRNWNGRSDLLVSHLNTG